MSGIGRWFVLGAIVAAALALVLSAPLVAGPAKYTLTTSVEPPGTGYVIPSGGTFSKNNYIEVTAVPYGDCVFDRWGGDLSGTENPTHYRFDTSTNAVSFVARFSNRSGVPCEAPPPPPPPPPVTPEIIGYFAEWGAYHSPPYSVKDIATSGAAGGLTIINYAFAVPAPDAAGTVACQLDDPVAAYQQWYADRDSVDGEPDQAGQSLRGHFNQLRKLKRMFPALNVVVSIGGWLGSTWFSDAAATAASRQAFVASCMEMFVDGDLPVADGAGGAGVAAGIFDGFDLDWEYPVAGGAPGTHHSRDDGRNFTLLLQEFRAQFAARGRADLLLTMAGPGSHYRAQNFHLSGDHELLDLVLIMTYDFHGSWERTTGHHTNLCTSPDDPSSDTWQMSIDRSVKLYRDQYRVPASKLVPGAAFYARGWKGVRSADNGLYQRASGAAPGRYEDGADYYRDLPVSGLAGTGGFSRFWDANARAPWLFNPSTGIFWSYDDAESLALKGQYVRHHRLGGLMFWELSGDNAGGKLFEALWLTLTADPPSSDPCAR